MRPSRLLGFEPWYDKIRVRVSVRVPVRGLVRGRVRAVPWYDPDVFPL